MKREVLKSIEIRNPLSGQITMCTFTSHIELAFKTHWEWTYPEDSVVLSLPQQPIPWSSAEHTNWDYSISWRSIGWGKKNQKLQTKWLQDGYNIF